MLAKRGAVPGACGWLLRQVVCQNGGLAAAERSHTWGAARTSQGPRLGGLVISLRHHSTQPHQQDAPPGNIAPVQATITDVVHASPTTVQIAITLMPSAASSPQSVFPFLAGSWVDVFVPGIERVGGYSITSLPAQLPILTLAVKSSVHPVASWLTSTAKRGDSVLVRPGGSFHYHLAPRSGAKVLFLAGGIGINPLYCMLRHLYDEGDTPRQDGAHGSSDDQIVVLYSARTRAEMLFRHELIDMAKRNPAMKVSFYTTRDEGTAEGGAVGPYTDVAGHIGDAEVSAAVGQLGKVDAAFICGPPNMSDAMAEACARAGVVRERVTLEKWW